MPKWKIEFDKSMCVGAGACSQAHPKGWIVPVSEANGGDGKAHIINGTKREDGWEEAILDELENHMDAAQGCPVNAIHIINLETGEQII